MSTRSNMTHELKSHPEVFDARWRGSKTFEFRKNDRDFRFGDHLHEREWEPGHTSKEVGGSYTGRHILSRVMYILHGGSFGIPEGYCIMSVENFARGTWLPRLTED